MKNIKVVLSMIIKLIVFSPGLITLIVFFYGFAKLGDWKPALAFIPTLIIIIIAWNVEDIIEDICSFYQIMSIGLFLWFGFEFICFICKLDFFTKNLCNSKNLSEAMWLTVISILIILISNSLVWLSKKFPSKTV